MTTFVAGILAQEIFDELVKAPIAIELKAFLGDIASGEATRWNELAGGGSFDITDTAYVLVPKWGGKRHEYPVGSGHYVISHGFGGFQFEVQTAKNAMRGAGVTDVLPQSQIKMALYNAQSTYGPSLLDDLKSGHMRSPRPKLFVNQWGRAAIAGPPNAQYRALYAIFEKASPAPPDSPPSHSDVATFVNLRMTGSDDIKVLQRALVIHGGYTGKIDGKAGKLTKAALAKALGIGS